MIAHFDELTVRQFQEFHLALKETDILDREIKLISICSGLTIEQVEALPRAELKKKILDLHKVLTSKPSEKVKRIILVKKKPYVAILAVENLDGLLSTSQWTAAKTYQVDPIENLHLLLPLFYTPYKLFRKPKLAENQLKAAEDFKSAKIGDVFGGVFFYSKVWTAFGPDLVNLSNQANKILADHLEELRGAGFISHMDGTQQ